MNPSGTEIDLLTVLKKSLDRAIYLYTFILKAQFGGARSSITIVHGRKFERIYTNSVPFRFFLRTAKTFIVLALLTDYHESMSHSNRCSKRDYYTKPRPLILGVRQLGMSGSLSIAITTAIPSTCAAHTHGHTNFVFFLPSS